MGLEISEAVICHSRGEYARKCSATTMAIVYASSPDDAAADQRRSGDRAGTNPGIITGRIRLTRKEKWSGSRKNFVWLVEIRSTSSSISSDPSADSRTAQ